MRSFVLALVIVLSIPSVVSAATPFTRPLSLGSSGTDVQALQQLLKDEGLFAYPAITGYYGLVTRAAVIAFQKAHGINPLGIVGPVTRKALTDLSATPVIPPVQSVPPVATATPTTTPPISFAGLFGSNVTVTSVLGGLIVQPRHRAAAVDDSGGAYTTGAVLFDGATSMKINALAASDSDKISVSYWYRSNAEAADVGYNYLFTIDPEDSYAWGADFPDTGANRSVLRFYNYGVSKVVARPGDYGIDGDFEWHHMLITADLGAGQGRVFIDGVDQTNIGFGLTEFVGGQTLEINGLPFWIGDDSYGDWVNGDIADLWIAPGVSLLSGGTIPNPTVAKFISGGKPVDLGADGSTPTGSAPAIFLRRAPGAAASTFMSNLGTDSDFVSVAGALVSSGSSPSD